MYFHRSQHTQITLHTTRIVVMDIAFNHLDQLLFAGKAPAVVAFSLQNAPEALHRAIVNTMSHAGHTLRHTGILQFVVIETFTSAPEMCYTEQDESVQGLLLRMIRSDSCRNTG